MAGQFVVRTGSDRREPVRGGCGVGYLHLAGRLSQRSSPGRACFKRPKRPKPMFAGFFSISKRPREPRWDALKSEFGQFGPMSTEPGTLGRLGKNGALIHRKIRVCERGGGKEWLGTQI